MNGSTLLKIHFLFFIFCLVVITAAAQSNIALTGSLSTSHVSPWENLNAIQSGRVPTSSADKGSGAYGNWDGEASYNKWNWVQLDWDKPYEISSTDVYWWQDGGGIMAPSEAYVQYWNGLDWVTVNDSETNLGIELNKWNAVAFDPTIITTKIKLNFKGPMATGILQWRVIGDVAPPCLNTAIITKSRVNAADWSQQVFVTADAGSTITFSPETIGEEIGIWRWVGPNGYTAATRQIEISDLAESKTGSYVVNFTNKCGKTTTRVHDITITGTETGTAYAWPVYSPTISYNFQDEFPALDMPTQVLDDCPEVVYTVSDDWWCFRKGPTANTLVTDEAIYPLLERLNTDFAYFRDEMGWPPDLRAKNGYRSAVYLFGSGLCTDEASNTELGGWQSAIIHNDISWPMVLASYYPIYSFDPNCPYTDREFQKGAMTHEGIHALLADLPGVKQSAWFHEGGNVWLQQTADARRSNDFSSMGDLNGTDFIAPFMPIECYSGWLQDGSFGGPSAEGVNMFDGSQQLCTWRTFLGGHQYSSAFPTFLGESLGDGSVPWIWRNSPTRVLSGIASGIGDYQMRRLITEYRGKQATVDFNEWTDAILALLNAHMGQSIRAEWQPSWLNPDPWIATPYVKTTNIAGILTPSPITLPGWSGGNQIPLTVEGDRVTVNFIPLGKNMTCQLVYRSTTGTAVYSEWVSQGTCTLKLVEPPANGVVIAVIANTDYLYEGEKTRKAKFDYRLQVIEGITGTANTQGRWFNAADPGGRKASGKVGIDWSKYCGKSFEHAGEVNYVQEIINPDKFLMYPNPLANDKQLTFEFANAQKEQIQVSVATMLGNKVYETVTTEKNLSVELKDLKPGYYIVRIKDAETETTKTLLVR
jgi:hypothetical protein